MPIGQYRIRRSTSQRAPDVRDRGSSYIESPAAMEREFQKAIERNKERLNVQRKEIKRLAAVQRGLAGPAAAGKDIVGSRDL